MVDETTIELCCDCRKPMPDGHAGRCYKMGCSPAGFFDGDHHCPECAKTCERHEPFDESGTYNG